ncbi:MAG: tetrahydromethanopterin S-methyltransferase subunit C [Candidatus Methanoperedenaceae archaeon]|nr:tetrahydromethanopterin S-methyltransferase subunit C [Candidatus Methanoperedenaceae archaeon]MDW7726752.1 tetrahydromethanopterin S-methyltransferase subunit C [Candidatus Methanoperedens sp.]
MADESLIKRNKLIIIAVVSGLSGIYLSPYFPALAAIGAIVAVVWGADAIRRVAAYGLGTGVPSIGQLALGMGIVASMFGLAIVGSVPLAGPVVALVTASVFGLITGLFAQHVIKMNIPVMISGMTEIAAAGSLIIVGFGSAAAGSYVFGTFVQNIFSSGIVLVIFWMGAMSILHPFNATLGPDEKQKRTLFLAVSTGAVTMTIIGVAATMILGSAGIITMVIGIVLWLVFYKKFWDEVYKDAASVVGTGLIPKTEA